MGLTDLIKRLPIDMRTAMLENVLLLGGTSMIPGFAARLVAELRAQLQQSKSNALAGRVHVAPSHFPRNMLSWVGGSIYAATDSARTDGINAHTYQAQRSAPDWLSVAEPVM